MNVRPVRPEDAADWIRMRAALWPDGGDDHEREVAAFFAGDRRHAAAVLLASGPDGAPLGFAELSIRDHAPGCTTARIAYLEGWYVEPDARRRGAGAALVRAAEQWGRDQGCTEFASDTETHNETSIRAHTALGFAEAERIVCFRKDL